MDYLYFELTRRCNQRCIQCFNNSRHALKGELGTEETLAVLDRFKEQGGTRLQLTGGESLMRKDIRQILERVGTLGFEQVILSTNGMLLKDSLLDLVEQTVTEVDLSLDGFGQTHDILRGVRSYDLVRDAIARTCKRDVIVYVCCCLTPETYDRIEEFLEMMVDMGVNAVKLAQIGDVGRKMTPENMRDGTPDTRAQFERITALARAYRGRISIHQSHTTKMMEPDVDRDGLVCDPCGRLYPMIGYLPLYWQVGRASPDWHINHERLAEYEEVFRHTLYSGVDRIVEDGAINWWTELHRELEKSAPSLEHAR